MAHTKKTVWLPFFNTNRSGDEPVGRVQLNPISAITKNESKSNARLVIAAGTLLAVFAFIIIGNTRMKLQTQTTEVSASIDMRRAIRGTVSQVDYRDNTFMIPSGFSLDPVVKSSGVNVWKVMLPPGESFRRQNKALQICYQISSLDNPTTGAILVDCKTIISIGRVVIVQYAVITPATASIIAQAVYGTGK